MTQVGFAQDPIAITTSRIPNPGVTSTQRLVISLAVGAKLGLIAGLTVTWPVHIIASGLIGPAIVGAGATVGTWLAIRQRKTAMEMAIDEFRDLGVAPEVIGSVIVESRAQAWTVLSYNSQMQDIQAQVDRIGNEVLEIVDGFRDDTSDIQRCRHVLARCLDQAIKILKNFEVIERRIVGDNAITVNEYQDVYQLTVNGLTKIADALEEQHRRNLDNNQTALEIDIEISEQLLH